MKIRGRRKEKEKLPSGITADYSASFFAQLDRNNLLENSGSNSNTSGGASWTRVDGLTQSDSSEASLTSLTNVSSTSGGMSGVGGGKSFPALPPKPPKRGILKGSRSNIASMSGTSTEGSNAMSNGNECENNHSDPSNLLVRNTLQNEVITYQNLPCQQQQQPQQLEKDEFCSEEESSSNYYHNYNQHHHNQSDSKLLQVITSASPSADSLTDTTNSSFATPPFSLSPVGESQGFSRWRSSNSFEEQGIPLPLPQIISLVLPEPRELTIQRQLPPRNDFGFSLRRAVIIDRTSSGSTQNIKSVIFAEPGAIVQNNNDTGLLPGDRLIEVNGINVDNKSREEIIDLIKGSGNNVVVKVIIIN